MSEHGMRPGGALWAAADDAEASPRARALADAIDGSVFELASDGTVVAVTDAVEERTGYAPRDIVGAHVSVVLEERHAHRVERAIRDLHETGGRVAEFDMSLETADGDTRSCTLRLSPVEVDGECQRALAVARCPSGQADRDRAIGNREEHLSRLVESVPGIVYRCRNERGWPMEFVSGDCQALTGYDATALERGEVSYGADVVLPADRDELWEEIQRGLADDGSFLVTYRIETAGGERRWVRERGRGRFDENDTAEALEGVIIDVTERMRQLRERERRLEQHKEYTDDVLDAIDDVFYVVDETGELRRWNRSLCAVTGYSHDEIASMHATDFFADDDAEAVMTAIAEGFETGTANVEFDLVGKSGDGIPFEFVASRLEDPDDNRVLAGIGREVSERVERERALRESERRYRTLAENFPNGGVGVYDEDLRYTLVTGTMWDEIDPDPADLEGETIWDALPPETAADLEPIFRDALAGETASTVSHLDGRTYRVWATPLEDGQGAVTAGLSFAQDITERQARETQLEELVEQLEDSNERLEQFAYAASHDLQEPLRMVSSYLSLIDRRHGSDLDEVCQEYLEFAVDGADRMREMINALLEYSRVETRGDPFEPVDLAAVVADARRDFGMRIHETDAEVTVGSLPMVEGDADQLRQVFGNLLSNALEYSGDEPPQIAVTAERDGSTWRVCVSDEGIGIDPEHAERVFQVFQRLHTQDEHAGTGIGLALCRRIVERHGGDIWVESTPGEGATFQFTLPAVAGDRE